MSSEQYRNKLVIFVGPSGSGKTTIARAVMQRLPQLAFSVSATTRSPRATEREGRDYYFIDVETFRQWIAEGRLLEYEEVYPGLFYGTPRAELERIWQAGRVPVLDIDINGAQKSNNFSQTALSFTFIRVRKKILDSAFGNAIPKLQLPLKIASSVLITKCLKPRG